MPKQNKKQDPGYLDDIIQNPINPEPRVPGKEKPNESGIEINPSDLVSANDESEYEIIFRPFKKLPNGKVIWAKWFGFKAFPMKVKKGA